MEIFQLALAATRPFAVTDEDRRILGVIEAAGARNPRNPIELRLGTGGEWDLRTAVTSGHAIETRVTLLAAWLAERRDYTLAWILKDTFRIEWEARGSDGFDVGASARAAIEARLGAENAVGVWTVHGAFRDRIKLNAHSAAYHLMAGDFGIEREQEWPRRWQAAT